jgi:glutaredoxin/glutathione-dependent peroxiredoxin
MTIKVGDKIPSSVLTTMTPDGPGPVDTDAYFKGRKIVVFSVPGAYTPTCSAKHLPGFVEQAAAFAAKGVDEVACFAVNDVFVMHAWGETGGAAGKVTMLADGSGTFTRALDLEMDASAFGMGMRSKRFSMIVDDGTVTHLNIEDPGAFQISSAEHALTQL